LQKFQNVKYLGIEGHFVDAENFQLLPRLTSLFLTYNEKVLDYGFLTEMIQLKELYVMNHEFVTDLSPIGHLTNLPILELYNLPQLKNVDFLADMQGLEVLELTLPSLQQFPVLSACPPIKRLVLEEITRSCDISAVAHLTSLEEFYIKESDVNAQNLIPVLEQLPHLKRARFGLEDEDWDKVNAYLVSRGIDPHANAKSHYG
jgi:Leucine-rich repeat (LRR) protein